MIGTNQEEQVLYSADTFRHLLDSLARPGKIGRLLYPHFLGEPPSYHTNTTAADVPLNLYALGAVLTLLDREVTFAIAANGQWLERSAPVVRWLALRSGAELAEPSATTSATSATFAFFCDGRSNGLLSQLHMGTLLEPEASATALYCVERITTPGEALDTRWLTLELQGPGIAQTRTVSIAGLDKIEISHMLATRQHYPLGVDVYLVDAVGRCIGLPRTTRIRFAEHNNQGK